MKFKICASKWSRRFSWFWRAWAEFKKSFASVAAMPRPIIAGTFSVPPRFSCSCGPPSWRGLMRIPGRRYRPPMPLGPWNLCAAKVRRSTCDCVQLIFSLPTACVASECRRMVAAWPT